MQTREKSQEKSSQKWEAPGLKAWTSGAGPDATQQIGDAGDAPAGKRPARSHHKISRRDLIYFIGQLGIMFDTGLNLMTALDCLVQQAKNPSLAKLVEEIRDAISEGNPLWVAMTRHPRIFTPVCVSMVRAGEVSGNMGEVLGKLEEFLERQNDIRLRVRSALSYPVFMLILSVGVLVFLLTFVFPKFEEIFEGREEFLPLPTRFFLGLSHLLSHYWFIIIPVVLLALAGAIWAWQRKEVKDRIDPNLLKIPLLGDLTVKMSLSRSFHTLSLMLEGGIPILDGLNMARDVAGNSVFVKTWQRVSNEVETGNDLTEPLRKNTYIPPSEVQMISMGDRSGQLPIVLAKLSGRYEKEIDLSVKSLIRFVEPSLVIVMGFLVGMIVLSLILPIFAMSRGQM